MCVEPPEGQPGPGVCHFPDLPDSIFRDATGALPPVSLGELAFLPFAPLETVVGYIVGEMRQNTASDEVRRIRRHIATATARLAGGNAILAASSYIDAMQIWKEQVQAGGPWDHKPHILRRWDNWSYDWQQNRLYFFDIWSNVHYGYVGLQANISASLLLAGAGAAQVMDGTSTADLWQSISQSGVLEGIYNLDDPFDQNAIRFGMLLYRRHENPGGLTMSGVRQLVRQYRTYLNSIHPRQYLTLPRWELNRPHQAYRSGSCAVASPGRRRPTGTIPLSGGGS